jgi:hypothetical protein
LLGVVDNGIQTIVYAMLTVRFHDSGAKEAKRVKRESASITRETSNSDSDSSLKGNNIQGEETEALLGISTTSTVRERERQATYNSSTIVFDSTDGFSALFLCQSIAIAVFFFILPLFAESSGRSSDKQFIWEESGVFALMLLAAACVFVDEYHHHR